MSETQERLSLSEHEDATETPRLVKEAGEELPTGPIELLRCVLGADEALRASTGEAENTWYFWWEANGERNGLYWRQSQWTRGNPASEAHARSAIEEEHCVQVVDKDSVRSNYAP